MKIDVQNDQVNIQYLNENYSLSLDELREFKIEIELVPSDGFRQAYYWIYSTSQDPLYKEMSGLVFCDLEDAIKKNRNKVLTR